MKLRFRFGLKAWLLVFITTCIYVGAYVQLIAPKVNVEVDLSRVPPIKETRQPHYRYGGDVAARLFAPICYIDQRLRYNFWSEISDLEREQWAVKEVNEFFEVSRHPERFIVPDEFWKNNFDKEGRWITHSSRYQREKERIRNGKRAKLISP